MKNKVKIEKNFNKSTIFIYYAHLYAGNALGPILTSIIPGTILSIYEKEPLVLLSLHIQPPFKLTQLLIFSIDEGIFFDL